MGRNPLFLAPWGDVRVQASFIERHCAFCQVFELPYDTPPKEVYDRLATDPERDTAIEAMERAVERLPAMFEWSPDEYVPDQPNPFDKLREGSVHEHYAIYGGRGGAKSYDAADAIVELASTQKERVAGAREVMKRIKESSKEILEARIKDSPWAADWTITEYDLRNEKTGSSIMFIGLNGHNAESVGKALEGITLLWTDEAQLLSQRSLDIVMPTIRAAGSRCVWTWNPGEEASPVDKLFRGDNPPERSLVQCRLVEDNPYLYRTRLAAEMRSSFMRDGEEKYRHIWRGAHLEITDATVFTSVQSGYLQWDALPCKGMGEGVKQVAGMDFGYGGQDPSAAIRAYLILPSAQPDYAPDKGMKPIFYVAKEAVERAVPNHELWKLATATGANEFICDSAMPLMIDALNASGEVVARPAVKGAGSLLAGIRKLQSCDIYISPDCPAAYEEFKNLKWSVDPKTGKVRRPLVTVGEDHTVAASRYALSEVELTEMQNDGVDYG